MELAKQANINSFIKDFIDKHIQGVKTVHRLYFKNDDSLSISAFIIEVTQELEKGYRTFIDKNYPMNEIDSYLFYIVNAVGKKNNKLPLKNKIDYLCPGCLFLGKENIIFGSKILDCDYCFNSFKKAKDLQWIKFYETFKKHNKSGYKCLDCHKFIPEPLNESNDITCPYTNCCFVGKSSILKRMHHPSNKTKIEHLILSKNNFISNEISGIQKLEIEEDMSIKISILNDVMDGIIYGIPYKTQNLTSKHKIFCCQAFKNLLKEDPIEMINYLLNSSRSGGFQHRVFQEYIKILENSLPLFYQDKKKQCIIDSLLDDKLSLFSGISNFEGVVNDKNVIKNNTQEFYIGGRKATYTKPYYIGKLLNIIVKDTKIPIMNNVVNYSFCKINVKNILPNTKVIVTHLRIPPHYQMGGMTYINRIRKHIVDKSKILLKSRSS